MYYSFMIDRASQDVGDLCISWVMYRNLIDMNHYSACIFEFRVLKQRHHEAQSRPTNPTMEIDSGQTVPT